jgi:hypothetical protein
MAAPNILEEFLVRLTVQGPNSGQLREAEKGFRSSSSWHCGSCVGLYGGGVRRVVSLPARFKTKAVLSTAFRLEGVSGLRPVLWLGQPGAGQRIGRSVRSAATILGEGK